MVGSVIANRMVVSLVRICWWVDLGVKGEELSCSCGERQLMVMELAPSSMEDVQIQCCPR